MSERIPAANSHEQLTKVRQGHYAKAITNSAALWHAGAIPPVWVRT
jgi:hypothetical protein